MANEDTVGAILEQLRAEVRAQRAARGVAEQGPLERDLRRALDEIEMHRVVSAHWPLTARSLPGRLLNMVNKVVRLGLRWYINPIVEQQNAYNDAVARSLRLLSDAYLDLAEQVAQAEARAGAGPYAGPGDAGAPPDAPEALQAEGDAPATAQLQAELARRATEEPPARFPDLELRELGDALRQRQTVSAHWSLGGTTLPERTLGLARRAVRQYLRWLINPIVEQQNAANGAIADAVAAAARIDADRRAGVAGLRSRAARRG